MAHPNQPSRVESILLALALAVAGTVFLADTMSSVPHLEVLTSHAAFQAAAVVMVTWRRQFASNAWEAMGK